MKHTRLTIAGGAAALMMSAAPAAFAAGTQAGTVVTNSVSLSYTSQGSSHSVEDADSASFTVDHRITYVVENDDDGELTVDIADNDQFTEFTISSSSNKDFVADLSVDAGLEDGDSYTLEVDLGEGFVEYSEAVTIPEDDEIKARVKVTFDPGTADGQTRSVGLTVTPTDDFAQSDDFKDIEAENIIHLIDDGADNDLAVFTISAPTLSADKSVEVYSQDGEDCGTFGSPSGGAAIPGACVQYTITVTNNGGAAAQNVTITDDLNGLPLTYVASDSGDGFESASLDGGVLSATASGAIPPNGASRSFVFHATIND